MAVDSINVSNLTRSSTSSASGTKNSNSYLSMDDFFSLLVAQLKNQDMYNTTDSTEFMAQLAQFSMVQALADLNEQSNYAYSVSLIGKSATISEVSDSGIAKTITGVIQGVTISKGQTEVVIDGNPYAMSSMTEVYDVNLLNK